MSSTTPFFEAFGPLLFGRPPRAALDNLSKVDSLEQLYALLGDFFPEKSFARQERGVNSRERLLPAQVTFWAFVAQALSPKTSCREIVRRIDAWWRWGQRRAAVDRDRGLTDSAYVQARQRLDLATLRLILAEVAWHLERHVNQAESWLGGRCVKIVDGISFTMPDTAANQAAWPQPSGQKPGCGFPMSKLLGLFSLASGALLEHVTDRLYVHDSQLFRALWGRLLRGDIVLADRAFCSYGALAGLLARGVDSVMRLHQLRKVDWRCGKRLGPGDRLVTWTKPKCPRENWTQAEWDALPETLSVRLVRVVVEAPGFRTSTVLIATTLTDATLYPDDAIRELYAQRWTIELHFAQIKTTLGLDLLRCQSPAMIEKELEIHLIAYNFVRALMQRAAHGHGVALSRISFKGTLDTLRHWSAAIYACANSPKKQAELIARMLEVIAGDPVPHRPGRSEPRARKRRSKNYQLLSKPRRQMEVIPHRNKYKAKRPKTPLS